MNYPFKNLVF